MRRPPSSARCSCIRWSQDRIDDIERIEIETQEAGVRIIDKTGPLANYADRDHCIQYMVAVPLIFGRLTADDYNDDVAADPRIDALRAKMAVQENPQFTTRLLRSGQALYRQFGAGLLQGRLLHGQGLDRLSDRPSQAPRRGHPGADGQVRGGAARPAGPAPRSSGSWRWPAEPAKFDAMPIDQFMNLYRV